MAEPTFSGEEAAAVQTTLRMSLGLPPERFSLPAFIGMLSDEIEQLRRDGQDDAAIATMLSKLTGKPIPAEAVTRFYATPAARGRPGTT